jgi:uncharacterized SAM-binding protein YcdF (DUF218 family)
VRAVLRGVRRVVVGLLAVLVLVLAVTVVRVVQAGRTDAARTSDVVLVLGAAQFDGRPQSFLLARLEHARALYASGAAPRVLTVGGKQAGDRFTEAQAGRDWLVAHGVPATDVVAVGEGNDTLVSVQAAATVMDARGWRTAIVVTDPWHELRSTSMVADQGITAYGSPVTTGPSLGGPGVRVPYVVRESVGYLVYEASRVRP